MNQRTATRPVSLLSNPKAETGALAPRRPIRPLTLLRPLVVPLALLLLWQMVTNAGLYSRSQLPAPLDVYRAGRQLCAHRYKS